MLFNQISDYAEKFFPKIDCDFGIVNITLHALFKLFQSEHNVLGELKYSTTELSQSIQCMAHDLLMARLKVYGLDIKSLNFLLDYLSRRKTKHLKTTKIDNNCFRNCFKFCFRNCWSIICSLPQGSNIVSLLI